MEIGRHQGMIANEHIKIDMKRFYEKVKILEYLGSLLTNQNCNLEEMK